MRNLGKEIGRKIQILFDTKEKILVLNIYFGRKDTSDSISHIGWSYSGVAKENDYIGAFS